MDDYNKSAEKHRARKEAKRKLFSFLDGFSSAEQHDILLDVLTDIELVTREPALPTPKDGTAQPTVDSGSTSKKGKGPTSLVAIVLREVAPKSLHASEIIERVQRIDPDTDRQDIHQALSRMSKADSGALVRSGESGSYRYAVRSDTHENRPPDSERVFRVIRSAPSDYAEIATKTGMERQAVRAAIYYLRDYKKCVVQRPDKRWEATGDPDA